MNEVLWFKCDECGCEHNPKHPHNVCSDKYQTFFYNKYGRLPSWEDAMSHCSLEVKKSWIDSMKRVKDFTNKINN